MMEHLFIIRRAEKNNGDAEAIYQVMQEAFSQYMEDACKDSREKIIPLEALHETVDDILCDIEHKYVYIAVLNGKSVGSIRVTVDEDKKEAYISRFGVLRDNQNMGIGKSFMILIDRLLVSLGVKRVSLHAASKYKELVRFYYGCGFYIYSTSFDKGYIRALFYKDYTD